jgi:hypothetical protein
VRSSAPLAVSESAEAKMKKLLLVGTAVLLMATSAQAQQFIGGSGDYGRRHGYQGSSVTFTPSETACAVACNP